MLKVAVPPTSKVVTLQELKDRLRVSTTADDAVLEELLEAATEEFEDRAMIVTRPTGFEMTLPELVRTIDIPAYPLRSVTAISYYDAEGVQQVVDASEYTVVETPEGGRIVFNDGWSAPALQEGNPEPVTVAFDAGYDDPLATESTLPLKAKIQVAIMAMVGVWYDGKEDLPPGFERIARQERIFR